MFLTRYDQRDWTAEKYRRFDRASGCHRIGNQRNGASFLRQFFREIFNVPLWNLTPSGFFLGRLAF